MGNSPLFNSGGQGKGFHFQAHLAVYVHAELGQWVYVLHARSSYVVGKEKKSVILYGKEGEEVAIYMRAKRRRKRVMG